MQKVQSFNRFFDMAVGKGVVSAFSGPADLNSFNLITHVPSSKTIHVKKSVERLELESLYQQVRVYREGTNKTISRTKVLEQLIDRHPNDWLLSVELYELAFKGNEKALCDSILNHLDTVKQNNPKVGHLIDGGLEIINKSLVA